MRPRHLAILKNSPALCPSRASPVILSVLLLPGWQRANRGPDSCHAVLDLSPRAHGLDQAYAVRPLCGRFTCRADVDLYRGQVRHRRHRHGQDLVADHFRHEQAAIRQARGAEFHHGGGEQRRQARGLVRPSQHPPIREHAAHPCRARLPAGRRYPHDTARRPPAGSRQAARLQTNCRRLVELKTSIDAFATYEFCSCRSSPVLHWCRGRRRPGRRSGHPWRSSARAVPPRRRRRRHVGQPDRRRGSAAHPGAVAADPRPAGKN